MPTRRRWLDPGLIHETTPQGAVCVFEAAAVGIEEPPSWAYGGGTLLLVLGGLAVANEQGSSKDERVLELTDQEKPQETEVGKAQTVA
mmetsp:Transcript_13936/g.52016  ORF Transcript_13936/g.52016 Transcript_13936/m.52016 type:complete len:88 (-) Transcript_13936:133-396(-)